MGIANIFQSGDVILTATLLILLIMSIISWSIAVLKFLKFSSANKGNKQFLNMFWESNDLSSAVNKARKLDAPMPDLAVSVLSAKEEYYDNNLIQLQKQVNFDEFLSRKIRKSIVKEMQPYNSWLTVLASIGSMAPFIGLFGTVIGIYHALINISAAGQVSIAEVAGPIGEALIATAFGLFVAVPAVMFYNIFIRKSKNLTLDLGQFADDLRTQIESEGEVK
ncbi:MAG: MotA/TolQ/ExbB proton channel family protein [Neisseriaceae bacterium]|nr:biopolymer transporter ExbB [Neisseriaceae bacterium PsAf]MCV2503934.1 MotA/TolQ/ExbB proton channel family protein [Neisseriaceae bacterium]MCV2508894.1 MotA/TolQ/ExbB proton channel family protein [Neisseriaceae bacterium]